MKKLALAAAWQVLLPRFRWRCEPLWNRSLSKTTSSSSAASLFRCCSDLIVAARFVTDCQSLEKTATHSPSFSFSATSGQRSQPVRFSSITATSASIWAASSFRQGM